jgi:hypothetical protein
MPRFLTIVKGDENHGDVPPALYEAIDTLFKKAGKRIVGMGGLQPSRKGARARLTQGKIRLTDGPFTETKELIGGFAIYECDTLQEAKEWTREFLQAHIDHFPGWDCEVEIREMMDDGANT